MPSLSKDNRYRIPPYLHKELMRLGFETTDAVTVLVSSLLFLWLQNRIDVNVETLVMNDKNRRNRVLGGQEELSEAEAALLGMFDDDDE